MFQRLLAERDVPAWANGGRTVPLETNRALVEVIARERSAGYAGVARFNKVPCAHHWPKKGLAVRPEPA